LRQARIWQAWEQYSRSLLPVSQPHGVQGQPVWTSYTYDSSGRTLTVTAPDGSVTSYVYQGNKTTVTDPAGKWKTFTTGAMGNLISGDGAGSGRGANLLTNYSYNGANQLTQVSMPRGGYTQTRTFVWSAADLVSATNPDNGTVTYAYAEGHRVTQRTDAMGQQTRWHRRCCRVRPCLCLRKGPEDLQRLGVQAWLTNGNVWLRRLTRELATRRRCGTSIVPDGDCFGRLHGRTMSGSLCFAPMKKVDCRQGREGIGFAAHLGSRLDAGLIYRNCGTRLRGRPALEAHSG
jgi:YD repeat-containing protein